MSTPTTNELLQLGIDTCGYLIPRNARLTTHEFANLIRASVDNPRAHAVASELDRFTGVVERKWNGISLSDIQPMKEQGIGKPDTVIAAIPGENEPPALLQKNEYAITATTPVQFYGTIQGVRGDRQLIAGMGFEIGDDVDEVLGGKVLFRVRGDQLAVDALAEYGQTYPSSLYAVAGDTPAMDLQALSRVHTTTLMAHAQKLRFEGSFETPRIGYDPSELRSVEQALQERENVKTVKSVCSSILEM